MKFVSDTGAMLSLACSDYLKQIMKKHSFIISPLVLDELSQFTQYKDFLGIKAKRIIEQKIQIKQPQKILELGLGKAEEEVFSLAKEKNYIALSDDIHAARVAKGKAKIDIKPSFYILLLLYKKKIIQKEELIRDIQKTLSYRNWLTGSVWEYAIRLVEEL